MMVALKDTIFMTGHKMEYDFPDGWTCIDCGDEFLSDTAGKEIANYDEGTLCKKCNEEYLFWANDTPNHITKDIV
jgi:DNA-directed RNA polymerase subunit RPC12/RpoP